MANPFEELVATNDAYHAAVNEFLEMNVSSFPVSPDGIDMTIEKLAALKVQFSCSQNRIFSLMHQSQAVIKPYFVEEEQSDADNGS